MTLRRFLAVTAIAAAALPAVAQSPFARPAPATALSGRWNGVNLELRSNCKTAANNGNRGTYAQFDVVFNTLNDFSITQTGVTGLNCEYRGRYTTLPGIEVEGTYSCTDGKAGEFSGVVGPAGWSILHMRLATRLTSSEACDIDALLSMARLVP